MTSLVIFVPKAGSLEILMGALFGFLLGYLAQRSRLCVTGAIRDFILFQVTRNLKYLFLILGTITFFYTIFLSQGIGGVKATPFPAGWYQVFGGLIFGIGMAIAGGCVVSTFYRIGEGSLNYLLTALAMFVGIAIGAWTFKYVGDYLALGKNSFVGGYATNWVWLGRYADAAYPNTGGQEIFSVLPVDGMILGIIQAAILFAAYIYVEKKMD
jgi:uncharacterized membrane protein YedE/YeeE